MGKKCASLLLPQVLVLLLLLCVFPCLSQSAPFSLTGRRLMSIYHPNADIGAGPSKSVQSGRRNPKGRRLMSTYLPNAGIGTEPSKIGPDGRRTPKAALPPSTPSFF